MKKELLFNIDRRPAQGLLPLTVLVFWLIQTATYAQDFVWARSLGGSGVDQGRSIAVDASGNVYTTGFFRGTVDFDPGAATANLTSGGGDDIFVSKLDASGNFLWARSMGGGGNERGHSIVVDASGNIYTTGYFTGTADFDPGAATANLTSGGGDDIFVSKLDDSGDFLWAKRMGGSGNDQSNSIGVDASGNVYTTGYFGATGDFDPGTGTSNLISAGGFDIFVSKLDAAGDFVWARKMGGSNIDLARSIAVDASGSVYTTGWYWGTADFDPGSGVVNLISAGNNDIFVSKLDAAGNFVWAKSMGGSSDEYGLALTVDAASNVYTTGYYNGTADFDPGAGTASLSLTGTGSDIFISKLDPSGDFLWAKRMGGDSFDGGVSIEVDASGNVYTTGYFFNTADFDPGAGSHNLTSGGIGDIFISKLDASGGFLWAKRMGGSADDLGFSIAVDASGNVHTTGYFGATGDFDPGAGTSNLISAGGSDIFVSQLAPCDSPVAYDVTGGGAYCAGGSGVSVGLVNSQTGVNYQLERDGNNVGAPLPGTGNGLNFGSFTAIGTYTVVATTTGGGCKAIMAGPAVISVTPLPTFTATPTAVSCNGGFDGSISITPSGGTGPYTFSKGSSANYGPESTFTGLAAGTYGVRVKDANGCESDIQQITLTEPAAINLTTSGNTSVTYGYGSNCTTLAASASGGTGKLSLSWSNGAAGTSTQVCPTETTIYIVTATDEAGCAVSQTIIVTVNDVRCANDKVVVCHKGKELCISANAVAAHLGHGDALGACSTANSRVSYEPHTGGIPLQLSFRAYPNPVQDVVAVEVLAPEAGAANFDVLDLAGRTRQSRKEPLVEGMNEIEFQLGGLPMGSYLIRVVDAQGRQGVTRVNKQ